MAIGSNMPDLDFFSSVVSGDKLEYLLEHRGHTHTVIGALLGALVLYVLCELWCRWRKWSFDNQDRRQIAVAALLALFLHVTMDLTNNYGVHPFWPFYNGWFYGDTIFIWEPLLWAAAAPLAMILKTRLARALVGAMLLAAVAACFGSGLVPIVFASLMLILTATMLWLGYRAPARVALLGGITLWIGLTGLFAVAHSQAQRQVRQFAADTFPGERVLDFVLTPMPANPLCWDTMLPMLGETYSIPHATWSIWPGVLPASQCPGHDLFRDVTAPIVRRQSSADDRIVWHGTVRMPREELANLASSYCEAAAFMHFARVPWARQRNGVWIVGDLRYDREPELGFAEIELANEPANCPSRPVPWLPPRSELLHQ